MIGTLLQASCGWKSELAAPPKLFSPITLHLYSGISRVDCCDKHHYFFKKGKKSFPSGHQAIKIKRYAEGLVLDYNVNCLQHCLKVPGKCNSGSGKTRIESFPQEMATQFPQPSSALDCKSQNHEKIAKLLASAAVRVNRVLRNSKTVHPGARF